LNNKFQYNLRTPDAIIAATARFLKLPLVTGDKKVAQVENIIIVLFTTENS
jgi:predicted nucleic acid-binding protein